MIGEKALGHYLGGHVIDQPAYIGIYRLCINPERGSDVAVP